MTPCKLTRRFPAGKSRVTRGRGRVAAGMPVLAAAALAGCIQIDAPAEPIVIELNINIRQEVVYRLASDVEDNIEANPDIF